MLKCLGKATSADRMKSVGLVLTGGVELIRLRWNQLMGRESIVHQPPCRRTEYRMGTPAQAAGLLEKLASSLETLPEPLAETSGK